MPVIKSAKKKLRKDRKREQAHDAFKMQLKSFIKAAREQKTEKSVRAAFQAADKAMKKHLIHKNKAARIKSSLSKLVATKTTKKSAK